MADQLPRFTRDTLNTLRDNQTGEVVNLARALELLNELDQTAKTSTVGNLEQFYKVAELMEEIGELKAQLKSPKKR